VVEGAGPQGEMGFQVGPIILDVVMEVAVLDIPMEAHLDIQMEVHLDTPMEVHLDTPMEVHPDIPMMGQMDTPPELHLDVEEQDAGEDVEEAAEEG